MLPLLVAATLVLGGSATRRKRPRPEADGAFGGGGGDGSGAMPGRKGAESPTARLLPSESIEVVRELARKRGDGDRGRAKRKRKQDLSRIRGSATEKSSAARKKKKKQQTSYTKKQKNGGGKSGKKAKKRPKSSKKGGGGGGTRPSNKSQGGGGGYIPANACGSRRGTCLDRAQNRPGEAPQCDRLVAGVSPSTKWGERLVSGRLTLELLDPASGGDGRLDCPVSRSVEAALLTYLADNIGTYDGNARSGELNYRPVCVSVVDQASVQPRHADYEVLGVEVEVTYAVGPSDDDRRLLDEIEHSEVGRSSLDEEVARPPQSERELASDSAGRELQLKGRPQQGGSQGSSRGRQCTPLQTATCCSQLVLNGRANLGRACQDLGCNFVSSCGPGRVAEQDNDWEKLDRKRGGKRTDDDWGGDKKKKKKSTDDWSGDTKKKKRTSRRTLKEARTAYLDLETDERYDVPSTGGTRRRLASCPDYASRNSHPSWYDNLSSTAYDDKRGVEPASPDDDPYYCPAYGLLHDEGAVDAMGCLTPLDPRLVTAQIGVDLRPATACASNRFSLREGQGPVLRCQAFEGLGCDYENDDLLPDVTRAAERRGEAYCVDDPTLSPTLTPTLFP